MYDSYSGLFGPADEYFNHQTTEPFASPVNSDPRFQDRCYFNLHTTEPDSFQLAFGMGNYPNLAVKDAYVIGRHGAAHFNILFSDDLDKRYRHELAVGALEIRVVEPMRRLAATLTDNPYGVTFELEFTARAELLMHKMLDKRFDGFEYLHQSHMTQGGTWRGEVRIDGQAIEIANYLGARDRSWGVRGNPPGSTDHAHFDALGRRLLGQSRYIWADFHFPDRVVHACCITDGETGEHFIMDGAVVPTEPDGRPPAHFVDWDWELGAKGEDGLRSEVALRFHDSHGGIHDYALRKIGNTFLMPHGWDDEKDDGNYRGPGYHHGFRKNLSDPADLAYFKDRPTYYHHTLVEVREGEEVGYGIFESFIHMTDLC
ncbi:MAG: hypothetical protein ACTS1X_01300 [Parasphingopyxis sp.]|uniref:hypothetical protein n=1 Tax=Parasphingopyxis sp. TaxID=1920299 RepID=UPI003FA169F8